MKSQLSDMKTDLRDLDKKLDRKFDLCQCFCGEGQVRHIQYQKEEAKGNKQEQ